MHERHRLRPAHAAFIKPFDFKASRPDDILDSAVEVTTSR
jgi:hypothetical protein